MFDNNIDKNILVDTMELLQIGNNAVKAAQKANLEKNIPNVHSMNGEFHYDMPKKNIHNYLLEQGFTFIFDRDIYVHKTKQIVRSREWIEDLVDPIHDENKKQEKINEILTNGRTMFANNENISYQDKEEIKQKYFK